MEIEPKTVLTKENYDSIKQMLESTDGDANTVGFEIINNTDTRTNLVMILFLIKEVNLTISDWESGIPKVLKIIQEIHGTKLYNRPTFGTILKIMKLYNVVGNDYQFYMDKYARHMLVEVSNHSCPIESIEIKLKFKENA